MPVHLISRPHNISVNDSCYLPRHESTNLWKKSLHPKRPPAMHIELYFKIHPTTFLGGIFYLISIRPILVYKL